MRKHFLTIGLLLMIVGIAVVLRLRFFSGMVATNDNVYYGHAAYELSQGNIQFEAWGIGTIRVGVYAPTALLYHLFGVSPVTTFAWPLTASILCMLFLFGIGVLQSGAAAGILAALFWAVLPQDIFISADLMPDTPLAAFTTGAMFFLLLGNRLRPKKFNWAYLACALSMLLAFTVKPLAAMATMFFILYVAYQFWIGLEIEKRRRLGKFVVSLVVIGLLILAYIQSIWVVRSLVMTSTDAFRLLSDYLLNDIFLPFYLVAILYSIFYRRQKDAIMLLWLSVLFLYFEWGSISTTPWVYRPLGDYLSARNLLFCLTPLVVLSGIYLAELTDHEMTWVYVIVVAAVVMAGTWNFAWDAPSKILMEVSALGSFLFFGFSFASPLVTRLKPSFYKTLFSAALMALMTFSIFKPLITNSSFRDASRMLRENYEGATALLENEPAYPIWIFKADDRALVNYAWRYQLGFSPFTYENGRLRVVEDVREVVGSGYVYVNENVPADAIPADWWLLGSFAHTPTEYVANPPQLYVYRTLSLADAAEELQAVQLAVLADPGEVQLLDLLAVAVNAGDVPLAFQTYLHLREIGAASQFEAQIEELLAAYGQAHPQQVGGNLLTNGDFSQGMDAWELIITDKVDYHVDAAGQDGTPVLAVQVEPGAGDSFLLSQQVELQPDSAYLYRITLRATAAITPLHIQIGAFDHNLRVQKKQFSDWVTFEYAFITPHWEGQAQTAFVAPVHVESDGEVLIEAVTLSRILGEE